MLISDALQNLPFFYKTQPLLSKCTEDKNIRLKCQSQTAHFKTGKTVSTFTQNTVYLPWN